MKKNKLMRLASCLLVGTLLTTCAISGTFAKYTTQDKANDSARVAKWGVELQIVGNLYGDAYRTDTHIADAYATATEANISVYSNGENSVAPGTKNNSGLTFGLTGKPEVDTQILGTITAEEIFLKAGTYGIMIPVDAGVVTAENFNELVTDEVTEATLWVTNDNGETYTAAAAYDSAATYYTLEDIAVANADYFPVMYNVAGNADGQYATSNTDMVEGGVSTLQAIAGTFASNLNGSAVTGNKDNTNLYTYTIESKVYDTNTDFGNEIKLAGSKLTWSWDYTLTDANGDNADVDDKLDTILGLAMDAATAGRVVKKVDTSWVKTVADSDYNLQTSFSIDITVNQID